MIKKMILIIPIMLVMSLTANAGYEANNGFTVTTIALDAEDAQVVEIQVEEDTNTSTQGEPSKQ